MDKFTQCEFYTEPYNGELVWCTHPGNLCQTEGNCRPENCPLEKDKRYSFFEILESEVMLS